MFGRTLFDGASPKTQSVEAVKQLITYQQHHGQVPAEIPAFHRLSAELVLVLSNKKDAYYVVTPRECSCPAKAYHPSKSCKHQRKYFPTKPESVQTLDLADEIRPAGKWAGGHNGPVLEMAWD